LGRVTLGEEQASRVIFMIVLWQTYSSSLCKIKFNVNAKITMIVVRKRSACDNNDFQCGNNMQLVT
jgi:hypothetical protein